MSLLYRLVDPDLIPENKRRSKWEYGYNDKYDIVVISKDGTIGDIYEINGLKIALPAKPKHVNNHKNKWVAKDYPAELQKIKTIFDWNRKDNKFKSLYVDFIEDEFDNREHGYWFMNNGQPTYITGSHYVYLQWSKIDVGLPDFRESNRIFYIFWEACKADERCYGMIYLKNRRSGFSFMSSSEAVNIATLARDSRIGMTSKTGQDSKKLFTDKVVPIVKNYPFFFRPVQDGMDNPKTEIAFRVPASKITKKNMVEKAEEEIDGLDTTIDWRATSDNAYDGEKLLYLIEDEAAKIERPENVKNGWRVRKTCLRLGSRVIGKCMMGSTSNALSKGGQNYKDLYEDSNPRKRNQNGQTKTGLYSLFIPMEHNFEGFIDEYGHAVLEKPETPIMGSDGMLIKQGVIDYWENEVRSLKGDPDALNEFYRQFPRTEAHAFRDESKTSLFNLTKIYSQIDHNDNLIKEKILTRGKFMWKDGKKDTQVVWIPDERGRFLVSWIPKAEMQNRFEKRGGLFYPCNDHLGAFGCDPYDISATVDGRASNGALHGVTTFHMDEAPINHFFLEYISRPQTAEIFFEDVLMACVFYGMPILAENNKARLLYHFKNRGYRPFALNRPDRPAHKLSATEREIGGIPNSSVDVIQSHASLIEAYVEKYVGFDQDGEYRDPNDMGDMLFNQTLMDWAKYDINNRTKFDATISSGLALMAVNKHYFRVEKKSPEITIRLSSYNNRGLQSELM